MSLLCNLLDISARDNHYLCSSWPSHCASSGHCGHCPSGGQGQCACALESSLSPVRLPGQLLSLLALLLSSGRCQVLPSCLITAVVSINTSLITMQPGVTPARCVSLVSLATGRGLRVLEARGWCTARPATRQQHSHSECHQFTITLGHQIITHSMLHSTEKIKFETF